MKLFLLLLLALPAAAQDTTAVWTQFQTWVRGEPRFGYQDASGRPRLPARFGQSTNAQQFRHIMAVSDGESLKHFYQLKNGRQVGRDSVYMFDFQFDCEQEGFIRFKDYKKDLVGFLDMQGRVVIPAQYNYLLPFYNGLAVAMMGARHHCYGGSDTLHCEHLGWTGGRRVVINQRNEVVIDQLQAVKLWSGNLNFYSFQRNAPRVDTAMTVTLTAVNGDRYTFTDYDKEFKQWFFGQFVPSVRRGPVAVQPLCYAELASSEYPFRGWQHTGAGAFVAAHFWTLQAHLGRLQPGDEQIQIGNGHLIRGIFKSPHFAGFLTDCGEHFKEKYPAFSVLLDLRAKGKASGFDHQWHYYFIRTAKGYRLYQASF